MLPKDLTCENITRWASHQALPIYSFSLCSKHKSSSSGPTPWKPSNLVLQWFLAAWADGERTIKDIPSIIPHFRVLNFNATQGLCKNCMIRAIHRLNDGDEMCTEFTLGLTPFAIQKRSHFPAHAPVGPGSNPQNSHSGHACWSDTQHVRYVFSQRKMISQ